MKMPAVLDCRHFHLKLNKPNCFLNYHIAFIAGAAGTSPA